VVALRPQVATKEIRSHGKRHRGDGPVANDAAELLDLVIGRIEPNVGILAFQGTAAKGFDLSVEHLADARHLRG